MMDKRAAALIMLDIFDQQAPIIIDWNQRERWIEAIMNGLKKVEKAETPGAATPRESK
jgi:hypothetical protein